MYSINSDSQSISSLSQSQENTTNSSEEASEQNTAPLVSFGIPVYNADKEYLCELLDSLLTQDLQDLEVVISDNASDNDTQKICEEYASRDPRVRYHRNPKNIGQIANFNKVLELAHGKYFRWIGSDDWLESDYARRCVEVLEAEDGKDFVGVTTYQDFILDDGQHYYKEYKGERLDSPLTHVRIRRHLWFMNADFGYIDIIYTMMRREVLMRTSKIQFVPRMDQALAFEIDLLGPFTHIPACLAHRRRLPFEKIPKKKLHEDYAGEQQEKLDDPFGFNSTAALFSILMTSPISNWEKILCLWSLAGFAWVRITKKTYRQLLTTARSVKALLLPKKENQ
ncbi:MAG: glycosyltransferase family 2 protein [Symploca sp. SIO2C1]|nr:glycosyltransferase family 2 protein [Symploca sp. SIO2C1]